MLLPMLSPNIKIWAKLKLCGFFVTSFKGFFSNIDYTSNYFITHIFTTAIRADITLMFTIRYITWNLHDYINFMKYMPKHMTLTDERCLYSTHISQRRKIYKLTPHNFLFNWGRLSIWKVEPFFQMK